MPLFGQLLCCAIQTTSLVHLNITCSSTVKNIVSSGNDCAIAGHWCDNTSGNQSIKHTHSLLKTPRSFLTCLAEGLVRFRRWLFHRIGWHYSSVSPDFEPVYFPLSCCLLQKKAGYIYIYSNCYLLFVKTTWPELTHCNFAFFVTHTYSTVRNVSKWRCIMFFSSWFVYSLFNVYLKIFKVGWLSLEGRFRVCFGVGWG